jgi:hypothetical protein
MPKIEESKVVIEPERIRLLADRLCWLTEGQDGMRRRHGMQRAIKGYRDRYDAEAERLAPEVLKPKVYPVFPDPEPDGWKQLSFV